RHLWSACQAFGRRGRRSGRRRDDIVDGRARCDRSYATSDGRFIAVGAIEPHFYANLLKVMGLSGESLPAQNDRAAWAQMRERFAKIFAGRTRDAWVALAMGHDACLAPVLMVDEAPAH